MVRQKTRHAAKYASKPFVAAATMRLADKSIQRNVKTCLAIAMAARLSRIKQRDNKAIVKCGRRGAKACVSPT
jgi:hypothetical protein